MQKESIAKFINKSKNIINSELNSEIIADNEISELLKDNIEKNSDSAKKSNDVNNIKAESEITNVNPSDNGPVTTSIIASDVIINGDIIVKGNLEFDGKIDGNIECHSSLKANGTVKGNIKTSSAVIGCDQVTGNIECENECMILSNVDLVGDVIASEVNLEGKINGTVNAKDKVTLKKSAVLNGDCITSKLIIEEGARVKGNIQTVD